MVAIVAMLTSIHSTVWSSGPRLSAAMLSSSHVDVSVGEVGWEGLHMEIKIKNQQIKQEMGEGQGPGYI